MRREVLKPMKLDACFNWPTCSDAAVARAVELDGPSGKPLKDDLHGGRPACPVFVRMGALRPRALATRRERRAVRAAGRATDFGPRPRPDRTYVAQPRNARRRRDPSPQAVDTLLAQVWRFDGGNGETDGGFYCSSGNGTHQIPNAAPGCSDDLGTRGATLSGMPGMRSGCRAGCGSTARGGGGSPISSPECRSGTKGPRQRLQRGGSGGLQEDLRAAAHVTQHVSTSPLYHGRWQS